MSFTYPPFSGARIIFNEDGTYELECDSCGGGWKNKLTGDTTLDFFKNEVVYPHLAKSHRLYPKPQQCDFIYNLSGPPVNGYLHCTSELNHPGEHVLEFEKSD